MSKYETGLSNLSYINKDFQSIYPELLSLAKKISYKWDPTISDESDPGVVLLKLCAIIADKNNYNIDKNILECFPESVTQDYNARPLFQQLGYNMRWYKGAETTIALKWIGDKNSEKLYTIPAFTMVCDEDSSIIYTITQSVTFNLNGEYVTAPCIQGTAKQYTINGNETITSQNLDSNNRLYFPDYFVAENGVFVTNINSNNYTSWKKVDNLYTESYGEKIYKFGISHDGKSCYIEFPEDTDDIFGEGINITYILTNGYEGNISANVLSQFYNEVSVTDTYEDPEVQVQLTAENIMLSNDYATLNGRNPETINEAYKNYKKTIGTFNTLVTKRDYENYLNSLDKISNCFVCDRTDDIQYSYHIMSTANELVRRILKIQTHKKDIITNYSSNWYATDSYYGATVNTQENFNQTNVDPASVVPLSVSTKMIAPWVEPYQLKLYALQYVENPLSSTAYNNTFNIVKNVDVENGTDNIIKELVGDNENSAIYESKSIQHDFVPQQPNKICLFKNKYPITIKIIPQYKLTEKQQDEVEQNITYAIYKQFNAQQVNFGEEINYDLLYDTIQNSDERIKSVVLDDITYTTYAIYFDDNSNSYKEVAISDNLSDAYVNGYYYVDRNNKSHFIKWDGTDLDVDKYNIYLCKDDCYVATASSGNYSYKFDKNKFINAINTKSNFLHKYSTYYIVLENSEMVLKSVTDPDISISQDSFETYGINVFGDFTDSYIIYIHYTTQNNLYTGIYNNSEYVWGLYSNKIEEFRTDIYAKCVLNGNTPLFIKDKKFEYAMNQQKLDILNNVSAVTTNSDVYLSSVEELRSIPLFRLQNSTDGENYSDVEFAGDSVQPVTLEIEKVSSNPDRLKYQNTISAQDNFGINCKSAFANNDKTQITIIKTNSGWKVLKYETNKIEITNINNLVKICNINDASLIIHPSKWTDKKYSNLLFYKFNTDPLVTLEIEKVSSNPNMLKYNNIIANQSEFGINCKSDFANKDKTQITINNDSGWEVLKYEDNKIEITNINNLVKICNLTEFEPTKTDWYVIPTRLFIYQTDATNHLYKESYYGFDAQELSKFGIADIQYQEFYYIDSSVISVNDQKQLQIVCFDKDGRRLRSIIFDENGQLLQIFDENGQLLQIFDENGQPESPIFYPSDFKKILPTFSYDSENIDTKLSSELYANYGIYNITSDYIYINKLLYADTNSRESSIVTLNDIQTSDYLTNGSLIINYNSDVIYDKFGDNDLYSDNISIQKIDSKQYIYYVSGLLNFSFEDTYDYGKDTEGNITYSNILDFTTGSQHPADDFEFSYKSAGNTYYIIYVGSGLWKCDNEYSENCFNLKLNKQYTPKINDIIELECNQEPTVSVFRFYPALVSDYNHHRAINETITDITPIDYTVRSNEHINFSSDNLMVVNKYSLYVIYQYKLNHDVYANIDYLLQPGESITVYWKEKDTDEKYQYHKFSEGDIISASFDLLAENSTIESLDGQQYINYYVGAHLTLEKAAVPNVSIYVSSVQKTYNEYLASLSKNYRNVMMQGQTISKKEINKISITDTSRQLTWYLKNEGNILFNVGQTEYTLQDEEYVLYSNQANTRLIVLSSGTKIIRTDDNYPEWKVNKIDIDKAMELGNDAIDSNSWFKVSKSSEVDAVETRYILMSTDVNIKGKIRAKEQEIPFRYIKIDSTKMIFEPERKSKNELWKLSDFEISYYDKSNNATGENGTSDEYTILEASNSIYSWEAKTKLSIDCASDKPQKLLCLQNILCYLNDTEELRTQEQETKKINGSNFNPTYILTDRVISILGGEKVKVTQEDFQGKKTYLSIYSYNIEEPDINKTTDFYNDYIIITLSNPTNSEQNCSSSNIKFRLPEGDYIIPFSHTSDEVSKTYLYYDDSPLSLVNYTVPADLSASKTHYLKLTITDDNDHNIHVESVLPANSEKKFIIHSAYKYVKKYEKNSDYNITEEQFNAILNRVIELDTELEFDYTYQVDDTELIEYPLDAMSFVDSTHPFNKYTICQADTQKSDILITSKIK